MLVIPPIDQTTDRSLAHFKRFLMEVKFSAPGGMQTCFNILCKSLWSTEPDLGEARTVIGGRRAGGVQHLTLP